MGKGGHHHKKSGHKRSHDKKKEHQGIRPSLSAHLDNYDPTKSSHRRFLGDLPHPQTQRYHPKELSSLLQENSKRREFCQLSEKAQKVLQMRVRSCDNDSDVKALMKLWLPVLDEIFFFSQVGPHLTGGIIVYNKPGKELLGQHHSEKSRIEINTAHHHAHHREDHRLSRSGQVEHTFIDTLLHEMLHAFLEAFICQRRWCCARKMWTDPAWGFQGSGHGAVWCNTMIGLQESFQRFVGWRVEYGIGDSVMVEMQDENLRWQPKEDHLVRWGLWGRTEPNPKFDGHKTSFIRAEWPGAEEEEEEWLRNGGQHLPEGMVMCCTAM